MTDSARLRLMTGTFVLFLITAFADTSLAQSQTKTFNVPAQSATTGIPEFARQAGIQILVSEPLVRGKKVAAVLGLHSIDEALSILLKGTGLAATSKDGATYTLAEIPKTAKQKNSQDLSAESIPKAAENPPHAVTEDPAGLAEILVKGSRIMNVDVTRTVDDAQPYYIFDSKQIDQSAATSVQDFLKNYLTMNTQFFTPQQSAGATAGNTTAINLRGLGTNETLILIDGRRSAGVAIDGNSGQPDLNGIPLGAIERIEVLPSSASAIYGGAAIGGVVNVILKRDFQGGEFRYTNDIPSGGDGQQRTINATYGFTLKDSTQIMISGSYSDGTKLLLGNRLGLFQRGLTNVLNNSPSDIYGAESPFPGATTNIYGVDANFNPTNLILRNGTPLNSGITYVPAGAAPGSDISAGLLANAGKYNLALAPGTASFGLQQPLTSVPEVKSLMFTIRRELTSNIDVFTEFSTSSNSSVGNINPFGCTCYVPSTAPDNPFQEAVLFTFPSAASTPMTTDSVTNIATVGLIAKLAAGWSSEFDYTWSRNKFSYLYHPSDYVAVNAAFADGTLNPFVDTIAHPLNLAPYLGDQSGGGTGRLDDIGLRASGPIGSLPWGAPILTVGFEHRKEGFDSNDSITTDPMTPANDRDLRLDPQLQTVTSVYAEALVPLVTNQNSISLVHGLELQLAGRSEIYTVHANAAFQFIAPAFLQQYSPNEPARTIRYTSTNPTIALKYTPIADVAIRASFANAFLPPTAAQLLPIPTPVCGSPCASIIDPKNGQTYNVDYTNGGNPNLSPQRSKDWDVGVIWQPTQLALSGLRLNLQYYRISQPNYITTPTFQQIVDSPGLAGRVTRDPTTGLITLIDDSPLNATLFKTDGWDLTFDYAKPTGLGAFSLHAVGTLINHDLRQFAIGSPTNEFVGFPADGGEAKVKANATVAWNYKGWTAGWSSNYISGYFQEGSPNDPISVSTYYTDGQGGFRIPSQIYHSLFGGYKFTSSDGPVLSNVQIQGSIKNIFNTLPPFDFFGGSAYYSSYGDPRLRTFWVSIRKSFGANH